MGPLPSTGVADISQGFHALILAGGVGSRLTGYSTVELPKQFLRITSPSFTMSQMTYRRLMAPPMGNDPVLDPSRIHLMTNDRYMGLAREQLPELPQENIIGEPVGLNRNTGPAVSVGLKHIEKIDPEAVVAIVSSDHYVGDSSHMMQRMYAAAQFASTSGMLVLFGIKPTWPSPDFGYVRQGDVLDESGEIRRADFFVEKPSRDVAKGYVDVGNYLWNGAMIVTKIRTYFEILSKAQPGLYSSLLAYFDGRMTKEGFYRKIDEICVNNAVFAPGAKDGKVAVMELGTQWSDVGSWQGVAELIDRTTISPPPEVLSILDSMQILGPDEEG